MLWFVLFSALLLLVVETGAAAFMVRRKHLDKWLPSYLFGMELCPRLLRPVLQRKSLPDAPRGAVPTVVGPASELTLGGGEGFVAELVRVPLFAGSGKSDDFRYGNSSQPHRDREHSTPIAPSRRGGRVGLRHEPAKSWEMEGDVMRGLTGVM